MRYNKDECASDLGLENPSGSITHNLPPFPPPTPLCAIDTIRLFLRRGRPGRGASNRLRREGFSLIGKQSPLPA